MGEEASEEETEGRLRISWSVFFASIRWDYNWILTGNQTTFMLLGGDIRKI